MKMENLKEAFDTDLELEVKARKLMDEVIDGNVNPASKGMVKDMILHSGGNVKVNWVYALNVIKEHFPETSARVNEILEGQN